MSEVGDAVASQTREVIRMKLERGESPQSIRARTEANIDRQLAELAADDPRRTERLKGHAAYQRAVEEAIREWEAERERR